LYWPTSEIDFNAAKGYKYKPIKDEDRLRLRVMGKKIDSVKLILDHRVEDLRDELDLRDYFRLEETCVLWVSHAESMGTPLKTTTIEDRKKVAQALVAAMTASFSSFSSFTTD